MAQTLRYPYPNPPKAGETVEVAEGVHWLRMPMPGSLDHINLYLLADSDGWTIVDTGLGDARTGEVWDAVLDRLPGSQPVRRIIVTHMHPDHIGQAGALCERFRVPLFMTEAEYFHARAFAASDTGPALSWEGERFYRRAGIDASVIDGMRERIGGFARSVTPLPMGYHRLRHGDVLSIAGHHWQVWVGAGHSPEHACLYCDALGVLLAGDQVLPVITSNVSVHPTEPEANPMKEWLASHERMRVLPNDTLVLPAHNRPFYGLHERLRGLVDHHEERMQALEHACTTPQDATALLPVLFRRELDERQVVMALGECLAHLHLLRDRGHIERRVGEDGLWRFTTVAPDRRQHGGELADSGPMEV